MISKELLDKAKYIQFPYNNEIYKDYSKYGLDIYKLPILRKKRDALYIGFENNEHHYTTQYSVKYVLPLLNDLFNFNYKINDFNIIENIYIDKNNNSFDLSYLYPKTNYIYNVDILTTNNKLVNVGFDELVNNDKFIINKTRYHLLFLASHQCSIIKNNTLKSDRKIFISCDSQMVPSILPLTNYYKEVWCFDNRTGKFKDSIDNKYKIDIDKTIGFSSLYKNTYFDDVLISLYTNPLWWYTEANLK